MKSYKKFQNQILSIRLKDHFYSEPFIIGINNELKIKLQKLKNDLIADLNAENDNQHFLNQIQTLSDKIRLAEKIINNVIENLKEIYNPTINSIRDYLKVLEKTENRYQDFERDIEIIKFNLESLQSPEILSNRSRIDFTKKIIHGVIKKVVDNCDNVSEEFILDFESITHFLSPQDEDKLSDFTLFNLYAEYLHDNGFLIHGEASKAESYEGTFIVESMLTETKFKTEIINQVINGVQLHVKSPDSTAKQTQTSAKELSKEKIDEEVRKILNPLKGISSHGIAMINESEFEVIVEAYTNLICDGETYPSVHNISFNGNNNEFYTHLRNLHDSFKIPFTLGGKLLQNLLLGRTNNTRDKTRQRMTEGTITKNIKTRGIA